MRITQPSRHLLARQSMLAMLLLTALGAGLVHAHGQGDQDDDGGGQGMMKGGGMMGGQGMMGGHGMMQGGGMMGGQGMTGGQGMMQGGGMMGGQGMMGGHGMMQGGGMMGGMGMMGEMSPYMAGVLGLSEDQHERMQDLQRDNAREHWQLMQRMRAHRHTMMKLQHQPEPDVEALMAAHEDMSEMQRDMMLMHIEMRRAMRDILTEEQRERLDEMRQFHMPVQ